MVGGGGVSAAPVGFTYSNRLYLALFVVAAAGFGPATSGEWARRADLCSTPRYGFYVVLRRKVEDCQLP